MSACSGGGMKYGGQSAPPGEINQGVCDWLLFGRFHEPIIGAVSRRPAIGIRSLELCPRPLLQSGATVISDGHDTAPDGMVAAPPFIASVGWRFLTKCRFSRLRFESMAIGPRDEHRSSYAHSATGLRWALAVVSVIAVAAVIAAVTLWLKPRHVEQSPPGEQAPTGVARADLEQITGQELRQKFPGPPVRITCPGDLPAKVGASENCVLKRNGQEFRLAITITTATSATDARWTFTLGEKLPAA